MSVERPSDGQLADDGANAAQIATFKQLVEKFVVAGSEEFNFYPHDVSGGIVILQTKRSLPAGGMQEVYREIRRDGSVDPPWFHNRKGTP